MSDYNVIIIGGGPAGSTAAISCARLGLKTLLLEKGGKNRHKICGGVIPTICSDLLDEELGLKVPDNILSDPSSLCLHYTPPSGVHNGGIVRNYSLLNIERDLFDQWLRDKAEEEGVEVKYGVNFNGCREKEGIQILLKGHSFTSKYLIGADGAQSTIRKSLFGSRKEFIYIFQELVEAHGSFNDYFYVFLKDEVSPTYGYVIPKRSHKILGVGVPSSLLNQGPQYMARFKDVLRSELDFEEFSVCCKEVWAIPSGCIQIGKGNMILVGDAAGFCNVFSGEGIRFAIESGRAAGHALEKSMQDNGCLVDNYSVETRSLRLFINRTRIFAESLTTARKEDFVANELRRIW